MTDLKASWKISSSNALRALVAAWLLVAGGYAAAQSSDAAFAEGVRLARDGAHRAAVRQYRQAIAGGQDSPLVQYNLGVALYRLDDFTAAETAFRRAAEDPALAPLALHNLGLVHYAAGEHAAAERAFAAAAAEPAAGLSLRRLAEDGRQSAARAARAAGRAVAEPAGRGRGEGGEGLSVRLRTGYGTDDNIYRTPLESYADLSKPGEPAVVPEVNESAYLPVDLTAAYMIRNEAGDTDFVLSYALDARYYESEFANADDVSQRLALAADIVFEGKNGRSRALHPVFYLQDHYHSNYDPDDGFDREIGEENLENRFAYDGYGIALDFQHRLGRWTWNAGAELERRDHDAVPIVASYDQALAYLRGGVRYSLNADTALSFGVRRYRRTFDDRESRDLTGALALDGPAATYDYAATTLSFERRFGRAVQLEANLQQLTRTDRFEGYDDYDQTGAQILAVFRPGSRVELSVGAATRTYSYPRAFAFNVEAGGPRETEWTSAELAFSYRLTDKLTLWGHLASEEVIATDLRADYERARSGLGIEWRL